MFISDGDIKGKDKSDKDEDGTTSKDYEKLLIKGKEEELMFKCNQCEFDTIWEDQLKMHIEWQHRTQKKYSLKGNPTYVFHLFKKRRPSLYLIQVKQKKLDCSG